jgi:L-ascorbate metabolism protein UlaG (beta-lactamase superfamily)
VDILPVNDKTEVGELIITRLSRASWFKLESGDKIIHFDPGYTGYFKNQGIPINELQEKADIVLISHYHKDHLQKEALDRIMNKNTIVIAPRNCANRINADTITFVKPGDLVYVEDIKIIAVDAYNTQEGHSTRKVHHKGDFVGYLININNKSIYFAGDTDLIPEMSGLGDVDIAFLPIGGIFVMDMEEAVDAVCMIKPKVVFPMHQSKKNPEVFKREVSIKSDSKVIILGVGDKAHE